ncbi:related to permease of the major facilitator superfamily [Phialocephala subalpina]|uniref:Related to permease of the major facilitator superfamily n=1 Tax=Phialocephala subalpina TaxID=576137 RepID=A0A1L7XCF3_9HELO|nr:related to permease of the major facilitator superfamily [Phialocephala subalpina]
MANNMDDKINSAAAPAAISIDDDLKVITPADADMALQVYSKLDCTEAEVAAVDEKKLLRKIDLHMLPIMFIAIALFTLDKSTLSYSSIMGIKKDAHLNSNEYSWLGSIFSLGYLFANVPCALIIQKVPLSKWVVMTMSIWGALLACMAACKNYGGLFTIRLLLGFFEASITPVFVIITGMWYKRNEQAKRLGIWYSGVGMSSIIGSPIAWGMAAPGAHTGVLKSWQLLYVVTGATTIFAAFCFYFVVPDSQLTARFLTPAERVMSIERIKINQQGIGNRKFKMHQVFELLRDPRSYLYFLMQFIANIGYGAVSTFGSLLITSLGYTSRQALILQMPQGAVTFSAVLIACYMADRMKDRTLWAGIAALLGTICGAILYGLQDNKFGSLMAFYFQHIFVATYILNFSMVSENTLGHTKKVLTNAILLIGSTIGSLTGPQITKNDESYNKVKIVMMICPAIVLVIVALIRLLNIMENRRRNRMGADEQVLAPNHEFLDLTDHENLQFRYAMVSLAQAHMIQHCSVH